MAIDKLIVPQRDFSGGQINANAKRRDDLDLVRAAGRQAINYRPLSTGQITARPGRRALRPTTGWRNERVRMTPTAKFTVGFSAGVITIHDDTQALVATNTSAAYIWTNDDLDLISWTQAGFDIVICFPGMQPQIARYDRNSASWSFLAFTFRFTSNTSREPFYRAKALGATMEASARTGSITLTCSIEYFDASMIGTYISILGQQVQITAVTNETVATGLVLDKLPALISWQISNTSVQPFEIGDLVTGAIYGRTAEVIETSATAVIGWLTDSINFYGVTALTDERLVSARAQASAVQAADASATWAGHVVKTVQWQAQFMGDGPGWPARCDYAQGRLVFLDFPQAPEAILFSTIGQYDQFWVDSSAIANSQSAGATPSAAILEFLPAKRGKARARHCVDVGDLLIFTDKGTWQVPVATDNPLKPGSVQFIDINADAVSDIRPVAAQDVVFYVNAGLTRVSLIRATGASSRSFTTDDISDAHSDVIRNPVAMALETGDDKYPERMLYLVNGDGTIAVGRQSLIGEKNGFGWFPWSGGTSTKWVTVGDTEVFWTDEFAGNYIFSQQDDDVYLDGTMSLASPPAAMEAPDPADGVLWWLAGETVTLMNGLMDLGERAVDADGNVVALNGEDLSGDGITAGFKFDSTFEPFIPNMQAGQSRRQRQLMRRVSKVVISVIRSTGFTCCGREVPPYSFDEDAGIDPPLREATYQFTTLGRSFDPRIPLTKTRPGPFTLVEYSVEVTV